MFPTFALVKYAVLFGDPLTFAFECIAVLCARFYLPSQHSSLLPFGELFVCFDQQIRLAGFYAGRLFVGTIRKSGS